MSKTKIRIFYDKRGETLSVWFDDPKKEVTSQEVGDGTIVSKDKSGRVIGFEKLYVRLAEDKSLSIPIRFSAA